MRTSLMMWKNRAGRMAALASLAAAAACGGDAVPTGPGGGTPGPGPKTVASVEVAPGTITLQFHETRQVWATPRAADQSPLVDRAVWWASSDTAVAFVSEQGTVWARSVGTAVITATSEGRQGFAVVEVAPPPPPPSVAYVVVTPGDVTLSEDPKTWQLTAKTYAQGGQELGGRPVAWTSSDTTRIRVYDGRLVVHGSGTTTVTATSEGKTAQARVTVPEWQRAMQLRGAAGLTLPALFDTSTYVERGVTHTVRRVVTDGALRFSFPGGRYEQRLSIQAYRDGVLVGTQQYFDRGTYLYDMWEGTPVFSSTLYAGLTFKSAAAANGGLAVTQTIGGEGAPATFVFARS